MKKLQCLVLIAVVVLTTSVSHAKDYHVYFLGGQSNMVGLGRRADLDAKYHKPVDGVMIFHGRQGMDNRDTDRGGKGQWSTLQPGHGNWFYTDGKRISYHRDGVFGPELFFGIRMKELYPERNIALIKYARNGTSIAVEAAGKWGCWYPDYQKEDGINQWDHALKSGLADDSYIFELIFTVNATGTEDLSVVMLTDEPIVQGPNRLYAGGYTLEVIPEPSTAALLLSGVVAFGLTTIRCRRRKHGATGNSALRSWLASPVFGNPVKWPNEIRGPTRFVVNTPAATLTHPPSPE